MHIATPDVYSEVHPKFPVVLCPGWGSTGFCWCSDKASEELAEIPDKSSTEMGTKHLGMGQYL